MDTAEKLICSSKFDINDQDELCELFETNKNISTQPYRDFKVQKSNGREEILQEEIKYFIESSDIDKIIIGDFLKIKILSLCSNSENYEIIDLMQQDMAVKSFLEVTEVSKVVKKPLKVLERYF